MSPRPQLLLVLALLALLASCTTKSRAVLLSSNPAGARILVNGQDSGFVTPRSLDLSDEGRSSEIVFELPGYQPAKRMLYRKTEKQYVLYRDWTVYYNTWRFPLWLGWEDLFGQVIRVKGKQPARVFVRLERDTNS